MIILVQATSKIILTLTVNSKIQLSQLITLLFTLLSKKIPEMMEIKSKLILITKINTVLFGKDQVNFQELQTHLFGVQAESLQKLPNKVLSEIAGSFHLPLLLPVFHQEFRTFS